MRQNNSRLQHIEIKPFLLLEDNEDILSVLKLIIESMGSLVTCFTDPLIALSAFQRNPNGFQGIFTDLKMPYMEGEIFIQEIRKKNKGIPIVIISAYLDRVRDSYLKKQHIFQTIDKPFTGEAIEQVVVKMRSQLS